jgi:hypothetical protein
LVTSPKPGALGSAVTKNWLAQISERLKLVAPMTLM